jgi:hypothetical protein
MFCVNIIESLYHRPSKLLRDPAALDRSIFYPGDATIALLRIVVACVDNNYVVRDAGKQIARKTWNVLLRNSYDYDVATSGCLLNGDRRSARLSCEIG